MSCPEMKSKESVLFPWRDEGPCQGCRNLSQQMKPVPFTMSLPEIAPARPCSWLTAGFIVHHPHPLPACQHRATSKQIWGLVRDRNAFLPLLKEFHVTVVYQ